jgi:hypothetical protein
LQEFCSNNNAPKKEDFDNTRKCVKSIDKHKSVFARGLPNGLGTLGKLARCSWTTLAKFAEMLTQGQILREASKDLYDELNSREVLVNFKTIAGFSPNCWVPIHLSSSFYRYTTVPLSCMHVS